MKSKLILVPLLSFFLVGCNGGPFANDEYKPKGLTPTHKIIRALSSEEADLFDDSIETSDIYLKSFSRSMEVRYFFKKALPNHLTAETYDYRESGYQAQKIYENDVVVFQNDVMQERIYQGSVVNLEAAIKIYGALNDEETEITLTHDIVETSGEHNVSVETLAYDPLSDYEAYFLINLEAIVWSNIGLCDIGMTQENTIAASFVTTFVTPIGSPYIADDGSKFIVETNMFFEAYFVKGVDEETEAEYFYLSYSRAYNEALIVSKEVPNIVSEPIEYLDRPILLAYQEEIINASTDSNRNFDKTMIPEPVVEEEE
ncbi:MAG: hypothetical protein WC931_03525 [Bacilli bacterium]